VQSAIATRFREPFGTIIFGWFANSAGDEIRCTATVGCNPAYSFDCALIHPAIYVFGRENEGCQEVQRRSAGVIMGKVAIIVFAIGMAVLIGLSVWVIAL
jgi:hypothetical protein